VIKKLDRLILKAFIGPFIATFFITLFVLVLQFFWLYIDDIVGKDIDLVTIAQLIGWLSATLVPLALPLAVLLSSIMTFGNLGETFELVAIKSAGIPLLRFMRPLFITSLAICGIAFLFNNYFIPVANLKLNTLKYDIIISKPAFDIKEGIFYDKIDGYVIKIGKKEKKNDTIRNVVIYEKNAALQDNMIVANTGEMKVSSDKRFLEFYLHNGWRYSEKGDRNSINTEFVRLGFDDYKKVFDLSSFKIQKTEDSVFKDNWRMLSIRQLNHAIDSLHRNEKQNKEFLQKQVLLYLSFPVLLDSNWNNYNSPPGKAKVFLDMIPDSAKSNVFDKAIAQVNALHTVLETKSSDFDTKKKELDLHLIEWHRKFTMSIACLVLFLIGAPLGSIIRKGGLGTPLVFAIVFFVIFFLLNNFGEKLSKQDVLLPVSGMWLATFILVPIGIFLTYKAMRDSQLFNQEFYFRFLGNFRKMVKEKFNRGTPE
jgi:lipopolysaccharide export system permease protein